MTQPVITSSTRPVEVVAGLEAMRARRPVDSVPVAELPVALATAVRTASTITAVVMGASFIPAAIEACRSWSAAC